VPPADIPTLVRIAQSFRADQLCLTAHCEQADKLDVQAFDPRVLRDRSHALLETLISRCPAEGGNCLVLASPVGLHFLDASCETDCEEDAISPLNSWAITSRSAPELLTRFQKVPAEVEAAAEGQLIGERLRALVSQGLLFYHAAVRLAQPRAQTSGSVKSVPSGSRWTAKSCRHPLRVRQLMDRAVRAMRSAISLNRASSTGTTPGVNALPLQSRFVLLLASACEFLADTFLAEDCHGNQQELLRQAHALRYLRRSSAYLTEYKQNGTMVLDDFDHSVRLLDERVVAKRTSAHLRLARLRHWQSWREDVPELRVVGASMRELDVAEELVLQPQRSATRNPTPHEGSLLASIAKTKADLFYELATLAASDGAEVNAQLKEYLEAQQQEMNESLQPVPVLRERWLQSTVSLTLRCIHHLASVPAEIVDELILQARALLARAYGDLGRFYAATGRFTKAMTHAKQGIELFVATKDNFHASVLQLWLCRLQLRLAIRQAAKTGGDGLDDSALLRGLSADKGEDAACTQAIASLRKVLQGIRQSDDADKTIEQEAHTLLGRVLLRQGLARLARSAPFAAVCRLCEEDGVLPATLELLQASGVVGVDSVRESLELMLQASQCFRDAGSALGGVAHSCLAAAYFVGRQDPRAQRLTQTHCQHAMEHFKKEREADAVTLSLLLAVPLLDAKVARRCGSSKSGVSVRFADERAVAALCDVALECRRQAACTSSQRVKDDDEERVPRMLFEELPLVTYVKQELGDLLVRLLKGEQREEGPARELKGLYCSLLNAWHTDAGEAEALTAMRDHMHSIASF